MTRKERIAALEQEIMEKTDELRTLNREEAQATVDNYTLTDANKNPTTLRDLFDGKPNLVLIHNMGSDCAWCTMWGDGLNGIYRKLPDDTAFVLTSPDSPETQREFAASRNWTFPMVSVQGTTLREDLDFLSDGDTIPGMSVLTLADDGTITHYTRAAFGPLDNFGVLSNLMTLLPGHDNE